MSRAPRRNCTSATNESRVADLPSRHSADGRYGIRSLYVLPRDGIDRGLADDGTLTRSVSAMQTWFQEQTGSRLRFVEEPVPKVRLLDTDAGIAA